MSTDSEIFIETILNENIKQLETFKLFKGKFWKYKEASFSEFDSGIPTSLFSDYNGFSITRPSKFLSYSNTQAIVFVENDYLKISFYVDNLCREIKFKLPNLFVIEAYQLEKVFKSFIRKLR